MNCTHASDDYGYPINVPDCPVCTDRSKKLNDAYTYAMSVGIHDPDRYMRSMITWSTQQRGYDETVEAAERSQDYEGNFNG